MSVGWMVRIDQTVVRRLHARARGERWRLSMDAWAEVLSASAERGLSGKPASPDDVERYLAALHLEDLALAGGCMAGNEEAWAHVVSEYRPVLYRAADSCDPTGGARELADSLYAELFGDARGRSLFRYFHGRSRLSTWLHSVMAQRFAGWVRTRKHERPLPDDESPNALPALEQPPDPAREHQVTLMRNALGSAIAALDARDRLRLSCYYADELTLAEIGRLLHEHEATASRHLARTRQALKADVHRRLRDEAGLTDAAIAECFASVAADTGPLDVRELVGPVGPIDLAAFRKKAGGRHSKKDGTL